MSSYIEDIKCPQCGGIARCETDAHTQESYIYCPVCKYESDNYNNDDDDDDDDDDCNDGP